MRIVIITITLISVTISSAYATLIDRGNGMIYDNVLDITWLQDANFAQTSGYDSDGNMTWQESMDWADSLLFGGYQDWRLAETALIDPTCTKPSTPEGLYCTGSELGYMFWANLGMTSPGPISSSTSPYLDLFTNIQDGVYWSQTTYLPDPTLAYVMNFSNGDQGITAKNQRSTKSRFAWAVRTGDVLSVPEPSTFLLLSFSLVVIFLLPFTGKSHRYNPGLN
ncbi:MAG: DUF1566 domain-containing protein [Pseudomonadales bacterium]|nr:DUF1566 domain-containing protein [Pseudomonadales bacterium]